jgi:hypothetical protein
MSNNEILISLVGVMIGAASLFCACFVSIHREISAIREQFIQLKNQVESIKGHLDSPAMLEGKPTDVADLKIPIQELRPKSKAHSRNPPVRKRKKDAF